MSISNENLAVVLIVGLVVGWLSAKIVKGAGLGLVGDLIIGVLGAFAGEQLLSKVGIHLGSGIIVALVNATVGALILLLIVRLVRGEGGWRRSWRRSC